MLVNHDPTIVLEDAISLPPLPSLSQPLTPPPHTQRLHVLVDRDPSIVLEDVVCLPPPPQPLTAPHIPLPPSSPPPHTH